MTNLVVDLKNKKTYEKILLDLSLELCPGEMIVPTSLGLAFISSPDLTGFSDVEIFQQFMRKESGKWVEYYIDSFFYNSQKFRYKRNRNLYNKHDKPVVVKVGECNDDCR